MRIRMHCLHLLCNDKDQFTCGMSIHFYYMPQNGHLYVLTFYDSFWPLFLLSIIGIIMYVTNAGHQFCHSKLNHNFFQDTVDIVAICVLIEKMIKKKNYLSILSHMNCVEM